MNENQHDASVALSRARGRFNLARGEFALARVELRTAVRAMLETIRADEASWSGTPGVEKIWNEVVTDVTAVTAVTAGEVNDDRT